jgi:hypothetical protein
MSVSLCLSFSPYSPDSKRLHFLTFRVSHSVHF